MIEDIFKIFLLSLAGILSLIVLSIYSLTVLPRSIKSLLRKVLIATRNRFLSKEQDSCSKKSPSAFDEFLDIFLDDESFLSPIYELPLLYDFEVMVDLSKYMDSLKKMEDDN